MVKGKDTSVARCLAARTRVSALAMLLGLGCQGVVGETSKTGVAGRPGTPGATGTGSGSVDGTVSVNDNAAALCASAGTTLRVGRTLLRRLTRPQFDNTVHELLGNTNNPSSVIAPDERIGPFYSNGIAPVTNLIVQQHSEVAATLAASAVAKMDQIAGCKLSTDTGTTCATQFINDFGLKAYRRPLEQAEKDKYLALFTLGRTNSGAASNGFQLVIEAMLQSPFFLYHADLGAQAAPSTAPVPLTSYELASRLSYFLWDSMPDQELFQAAAGDKLQDTAVLTAEVDRMLKDSRAAQAIPSFHLQWLGIDDMSEVVKDTKLFPQFDGALVDAMQAETGSFADHVVRTGDGLLSTLLTAPYSYLDGPLFSLYGATQPTGFKLGDQVALDPKERGGLLTQAAFLTTKSHRDQTSPVHRGILIRENLLCQPIAAPPPNVNATPPPASVATTTRQRFAQHESDPVCGGCHKMMDPIGLGLENYDPIGAWRTQDGTSAVDPSGEIVEANADVAGKFVGAIELGQKLAKSRQVSDCLATQWLRYSLGRMETVDDACTVQAIHDGFAASGGNVRELLKTIVLGDAFRHVRAVGGSQ
jgi:hypothetical protein